MPRRSRFLLKVVPQEGEALSRAFGNNFVESYFQNCLFSLLFLVVNAMGLRRTEPSYAISYGLLATCERQRIILGKNRAIVCFRLHSKQFYLTALNVRVLHRRKKNNTVIAAHNYMQYGTVVQVTDGQCCRNE